MVQPNIQRVTVPTFASGLPDSGTAFQIVLVWERGKQKKLSFFYQALLKIESKQMSVLTHTAPETAVRCTDTDRCVRLAPVLDQDYNSPSITPSISRKEYFFFLNIRLGKIIKHLSTYMLGNLVHSMNTVVVCSQFSTTFFSPVSCVICCLAIPKHIFMMSFYSIQITICLFH